MAGLEFLRPLTITILLLQKIGAPRRYPRSRWQTQFASIRTKQLNGWVMLMSLLICGPVSRIPPNSDSSVTIVGIWRKNREEHSLLQLIGRHGLRKKLCYS